LQFSTTAINSEDSNLLRYEVDSAFTGSLKHTIQIVNPTYSRVSGGKLFVPIIGNETARHYVIYNISSSTGNPTILTDDSGNLYAYWSNIEINAKQNFTIEINYCLLSFNIHHLINSSLMTEYNETSDLYKKYTQPEKLIQSNDPRIISEAQNITSGETNPHEKVFKIYNFVITHMHYATQQEERGALWALENGIGDCSEYSYLFVALCRAAGIPAKAKAGFAFHYSSETIEDGHMWAEYYLENYGWIPVDATWQLFDTINYRHFSSIQSIPELTPYTNYFFNSTAGPEPYDEQTVKLKPCSPNTFDDSSYAENMMKTAQKITQAKFALFIGRVFGTHLIFPSKTEKTTQTLLESQIYLQNAIESWKTPSQLAQNIANALENAEKASRDAWMLIVEVFTIFISIPIVILLIALVFLKRYLKQARKHSSAISKTTA
jgi:hypothetical protein